VRKSIAPVVFLTEKTGLSFPILTAWEVSLAVKATETHEKEEESTKRLWRMG
jgi:hypothetical protein